MTLFFLAGAVGGLFCLAFLVGVLFIEPVAFFLAMAIGALVWHVGGKPWTKAGRQQARRGGMANRQPPPCYDDEQDY